METEAAYVPTYFARQPILDENMEVQGYNLLYRSEGSRDTADFSDADIATLEVICEALVNMDMERDSRRIYIHVTPQTIKDVLTLSLQPRRVALMLSADEEPDAELLEQVRKVCAASFRVALNNYGGQPSARPLLALADAVVVDVQKVPDENMQNLLADLPSGVVGMATRVETRAQFERAREHGFGLFKGFFFSKPQLVTGRRLSANALTKLRLTNYLLQGNEDTRELAQLIQADVTISYRLLSLINSAAFGYSGIDSIERAVVLLGWERVRHWLLVVVLTDIQPQGKSSELPYMSAIRGRFLEAAAKAHGITEPSPQSLFLLGLFSMLEPMLDMPMHEILDKLPLDPAIKEALVDSSSRMARWLELARCFESGDWSRLDQLVAGLGLDPNHTARAYFEAIAWSKNFFN